MIALKDPGSGRLRNPFYIPAFSAIVNRSTCQVMTFMSERGPLITWKNIVIPVKDFVPEQRINTIFRIAREAKITIHLVMVGSVDSDGIPSQFSYLVEALKILKSVGHIKVVCKCVKRELNTEQSVLNYARAIEADAIMTNRKKIGAVMKGYWQRQLDSFLEFSSKALPGY